MLFSLMLWMPSWGGMINGLLTLRGAWHKVAEDPILKFYVVGVTFYGMSTFEGPMLSIKSVNAMSHYTDWTIAHVHAGALGWVGFMTFGMAYWLMPRLYQAKLWSPKLMGWHFWTATIGILLYIIPIYVAGITQGLMWLAFDDKGMLAYPDFVETVNKLIPFYWARVFGGTLYLTGAIFCVMNLYMTWRARPAKYEEPVHQAAALSRSYAEPPIPGSRIKNVLPAAHKIDVFSQLRWHRRWEGVPLKFTIWTAIALNVGAAGILMLPGIDRRMALLDAACVMAFVGLWIEKGMGLIVPAFIPSTLHEMVEYQPSLIEWRVSAGIWAAGLMIYTLLLKVAIPVLNGQLADRVDPTPDDTSGSPTDEPSSAT